MIDLIQGAHPNLVKNDISVKNYFGEKSWVLKPDQAHVCQELGWEPVGI
jgi:hypothetical protein